MSTKKLEAAKRNAALSENARVYTKETNLFSWNGAASQPDIRKVHPCHETFGRGIMLTSDEGQKLQEALARLYGEIDAE